MTLTIRNTLRSLSALVLTAAFMPGCDGEDYEALGLSAEQIDSMSEEELDELATLEDHDELDIAAPERPGQPDPIDVPHNITGPNTAGPTDGGIPDTFWDPRYTHGGAQDAGLPDTFWDPRYTHVPPQSPLVQGLANPVNPTHGAPLLPGIRETAPGGCQPSQPNVEFANG